ncbi:MAG TPA: MBG domain-containing protein, partial [Luteolibacter sp.]|nr:MBG domain-containing protein [Luteolibacter sp.]
MIRWLHPLVWSLGITLLPAATPENLADILQDPGMNLADDAGRARVVERMAWIETDRRARARAKAAAAGLPLRSELANGRVMEIHSFDGPEPVYLTTHNVNAAISTGANLLQSSPYTLNGNGLTIGMWDGGSGRATHQEFGGRMVVRDGSASINHATHVGGTLIASGVTASARGMATAAVVDTYDWNNDISEMTGRGATGPGQQATRIYLSNHSYGYISGWYNTGGTGSPPRTWEWYGNGTTATSIEQDFGRYNDLTREIDTLVFNAPYYLIFQSAGNDRNDNPSAGQSIALSPGSSTVVSYDPALHPAGDGNYRGGFETIGFRSLAKNIVTVGSANDAVTGGVRDPSKATLSAFSCWGPTDDGRIKPDVVANGAGLYSSLNTSNSAYGTYSGTSMSSPNACGSAALLVQQYGQLFPGSAMRAATLKGLLIHTATDLGNPGPDYKSGWGLINVKTAADLIADHHAIPLKQRITESQLTTSVSTLSYPFLWDETTPIRATLCWTDPAGTATTTSDLRSPRLVNNLQLKLIAPNGSEHFPFVMPFVGTWTQASMDLPATTGINNTDNVEQVYVSSPGIPGTWQAVVTYSGTLANNAQQFSLILDGPDAEAPPPPPVFLSSISPTSGLSGSLVTVEISGTSLGTDTVIKLSKSGQPDIPPVSQNAIGADLICQFDLSGAATGPWSVVATNPDESTSTLIDAFTVIGALWSENFDGSVSGWTSNATTGSNSWTLTTAQSHTPDSSYFAPGPATKTTCSLTSPAIAIPPTASNMQLKFWHRYELENERDGGVLEFSVDGGPWTDITATNSGTSFASNAYVATLRNVGGGPNAPSDLGGRSTWTGNSGGFVETIVNLTDNAKFAGNTLRLRWIIATNASTSSTGWYVDSVALIGDGNLANQPPAITNAATSSSTETVTDPDTTVWRIERGTSTTLSVAASDDGGAGGLTYTWNVSGPAPVFVSPNASNSASVTTAEFEQTGDYIATVTVTDAQGLAVGSSVNLRVTQTASGLVVSPAVASLTVGQTQSFSAVINDQFGALLGSQPPSFTWGASGGGTINSSGLFTATSAGGPFAITASSGGFSDFASVTVNPIPATITLGNLDQTYDGTPRAATATTDPPGLAYEIIYNESDTTPPTDAGSYPVLATITDPNHQGGDSGTLVIAMAGATVMLSNLTQTFDGTPKPVTVTTTPEGLATEVTYDGGATAPSDAGSYAVVATVTDPNYDGSANGTLLIEEIDDFTAWQYDNFTEQQILDGLADDMEDPENDGLYNLAEFALGTDPWEFTPLPAATKDENGLTLVFTRPEGLAGVSYVAETSEGMDTWSPVP